MVLFTIIITCQFPSITPTLIPSYPPSYLFTRFPKSDTINANCMQKSVMDGTVLKNNKITKSNAAD